MSLKNYCFLNESKENGISYYNFSRKFRFIQLMRYCLISGAGLLCSRHLVREFTITTKLPPAAVVFGSLLVWFWFWFWFWFGWLYGYFIIVKVIYILLSLVAVHREIG